MKVAISSLAFGGKFDDDVASLVVDNGISGVELAPTAIWGIDDYPTARQAEQERVRWEDAGLALPSIQSVLYGRPELRLFDRECWPALQSHLVRMAETASALGAEIMVFGSPRNRVRGNIESLVAVEIASEFFSLLQPALVALGVTMTLEPNPQLYGADFMTTYDEVLAVVDAVGSPRIQPQIDTGCLSLAGVDPADAVDKRVPWHVHVSAQGLGIVPGEHIDHVKVASSLRAVLYDGWVNVEMLDSRIDGAKDVERATRWAVAVYGG